MTSNLKMAYFEAEDVLHLVLAEGVEAGSVEVTPNITVELNEQGEMIGLEILQASQFLRDSIMESIQGKLLHWDNLSADKIGQVHPDAIATGGDR